jgi:hypothetical protein
VAVGRGGVTTSAPGRFGPVPYPERPVGGGKGMSFGQHLRALREGAGLSRAGLAREACVPVSTLVLLPLEALGPVSTAPPMPPLRDAGVVVATPESYLPGADCG